MNNSNLPPQLQYDFLGDSEEEDDVHSETGEENPNFVYDDDEPMNDNVINIQEKIVDFVEPEPIRDEEIFDMGEVVKPVEKKPEKNVVNYNTEATPPPVPLKANGKPVKLNKNGKPRKQISPEHLAKLQEARKKALETRRANKKEKVNTKELEKKKKQLLIEKQQLEVSELEEQVKTKSTKPIQKIEYVNGLTKEDLYTAQLEAITKYDSVRKAEKKKKKEEKMIETQKKEMLNKIQQSGWKNTAGIYHNCF
tara:strand:+ start:2954 stop:3709 length:756 start_codon:yes stop_codon:yes gene_type:complete